MSNCDLAIYASQWSARTAKEYDEVNERKIRVVPFGANLSSVPSVEEVARLLANRSDRVCELLLIGVNWFNKGGPKALEIARLLNKRGIRTRPPRCRLRSPGERLARLDRIPRVHYQSDQGRLRQTRRTDRPSHFLLLPTLADCFGLVLCEANAFGVPSLANDVGGVGEVVKPDVNGCLFAADAPAGCWADRVGELFTDRTAYAPWPTAAGLNSKRNSTG